MPRNLDSLTPSSTFRYDGVPKRVSVRATRVSHLAWELVLVAVLLLVATAIFSGDLPGPQAPSPDRLALAGHTHAVESVTVSTDGRTLASSGWDNTVRLWDVGRKDQGRKAAPVSLPHTSVRVASAFSPDGSILVATGVDSLTIWSCGPDYHPIVEKTGRSYRCATFAPDGRTLVLGAEDGTIRLWDMPSARERMVLSGHSDAVRSVVFSPDGRLLASSSQDGRVVLWDPSRGTAVRTLASQGPYPVRSLAFSPDGRTVGFSEVAWEPRDVLLMDVETGAIRTRLTGHRLGINALAFSPDGRTLATAGVDRCLKLWDLATGTERATLRDHVGWVHSIVFSPDSTWLAYAGNDPTIRLWDLPPQPSHPTSPLASGAGASPAHS